MWPLVFGAMHKQKAVVCFAVFSTVKRYILGVHASHIGHSNSVPVEGFSLLVLIGCHCYNKRQLCSEYLDFLPSFLIK